MRWRGNDRAEMWLHKRVSMEEKGIDEVFEKRDRLLGVVPSIHYLTWLVWFFLSPILFMTVMERT